MSWGNLPFKLKVYVITVACLALPIIIWAGWDLATKPYNGWLVLGILAVATVPFFLFLPSFSATITIGDAYIMAIAMMYGTAPCILVTFVCILSISIFAQRPKIHVYRVVFNTASTTCCAFLYSSIYYLLNRGSKDLQDVLLPGVAVVITYFLSNSLLTSLAIAWSNSESVLKFWIKSCLPLANDYSLSAVSAIIIVALNSFSDLIPLAVAPLIGLAWGWNQVNKTRVMEAERHLKEQEQLYLRTVESLALAVDAKDQTTYGHIRRVRVYATHLAKLCGIKDPNEMKAIETASLLHDIGKLAIDDYILNKPGKLTKEEFEKIKIHAAAGDEILQHVHFPFPAAKYVRHHHERWDGKGYPDGLKGEEIPLGSRILAVADAFDAIRFSRPYKMAIPIEEAKELLQAQAGIIYDPQVVNLFLANIEDLEAAAVREAANLPEPSFRKYFETVNRALSAADVSASPSLIPPDLPAEMILLYEFCSMISGQLELEDLFSVFAVRMRRIVPFDACAFYLNAGNGYLRPAYADGVLAEKLRNNLIPIGKGISGWVFAHKRPMMNAGPSLDFTDIDADFSGIKDTLVVPIIHEDEALGTISLYAGEESRYTSHDRELMQALSGYLAPLIAMSQSHHEPAAEKIVDPITRIHRLSYLAAVGPQLIALAEKNNCPASLIFMEIRNLNQIGRLYGTNMANTAIKRISDCIKLELRDTDILARFGPQAFVCFLPGAREEQATHCAQRLKQQVWNYASSVEGQSFPIDFRVGIASYPRDGINILSLLRSAQKNLETRIESVVDNNVIGFLPRS